MATGMRDGSEMTWALVTEKMYRFCLARGFPWENCLSEEAETGCAGFPGGGQKEQSDSGRTGPGMFEEDESSGVCYAGCWGLVGHPRRPRCQAGEPGHSSLCRGLRIYPNSSHLSIRSLMAGTCTKSDNSVTHEACVSARRTHPHHVGDPRPPPEPLDPSND